MYFRNSYTRKSLILFGFALAVTTSMTPMDGLAETTKKLIGSGGVGGNGGNGGVGGNVGGNAVAAMSVAAMSVAAAAAMAVSAVMGAAAAMSAAAMSVAAAAAMRRRKCGGNGGVGGNGGSGGNVGGGNVGGGNGGNGGVGGNGGTGGVGGNGGAGGGGSIHFLLVNHWMHFRKIPQSGGAGARYDAAAGTFSARRKSPRRDNPSALQCSVSLQSLIQQVLLKNCAPDDLSRSLQRDLVLSHSKAIRRKT